MNNKQKNMKNLLYILIGVLLIVGGSCAVLVISYSNRNIEDRSHCNITVDSFDKIKPIDKCESSILTMNDVNFGKTKNRIMTVFVKINDTYNLSVTVNGKTVVLPVISDLRMIPKFSIINDTILSVNVDLTSQNNTSNVALINNEGESLILEDVSINKVTDDVFTAQKYVATEICSDPTKEDEIYETVDTYKITNNMLLKTDTKNITCKNFNS